MSDWESMTEELNSWKSKIDMILEELHKKEKQKQADAPHSYFIK
jgi:hypothetical protein